MSKLWSSTSWRKVLGDQPPRSNTIVGRASGPTRLRIASDGCFAVSDGRFEAADLFSSGAFGGVGHAAVGVVVDDGVAVEAVEGEVGTAVAEVVLLAPPVEHPGGDLGGGQVEP